MLLPDKQLITSSSQISVFIVLNTLLAPLIGVARLFFA